LNFESEGSVSVLLKTVKGKPFFLPIFYRMGKNPQVISSCFALTSGKCPSYRTAAPPSQMVRPIWKKFPARVICPSLPEYSVIFQEKNIVVFCQTPVLSGVQAIQAEGRAMWEQE